jgi:hypothetical protein
MNIRRIMITALKIKLPTLKKKRVWSAIYDIMLERLSRFTHLGTRYNVVLVSF